MFLIKHNVVHYMLIQTDYVHDVLCQLYIVVWKQNYLYFNNVSCYDANK
jgi:fatty acid desaturase